MARNSATSSGVSEEVYMYVCYHILQRIIIAVVLSDEGKDEVSSEDEFLAVIL